MAHDPKLSQALAGVCDRLAERTAVLFLGAGVNWGIQNDAGAPFPLGQGLADNMARDLLERSGLGLALDDVAEMAEDRVGVAEVNRYLYEHFETFRPGLAHLALVQLPWDVVYTTNYDLLVERADESPAVKPAGRFRPIVSTGTDLATFDERDIPYYKLHGSVDTVNADGWLVLTKRDYRRYLTQRVPLFRRLERDLRRRTFVFLGYALRDPNFREILDLCQESLGGDRLPLSYAVRPEFAPAEEAFWRERYNVQLIAADGATFLGDLTEAWHAAARVLVAPGEPDVSRSYAADAATRFPRVGDAFYRVTVGDVTGTSDARAFFRGSEAGWPDVRDGVAPPRDLLAAVRAAVLADVAAPDAPPSLHLVTGAAGTGKTTLVRTLAFELVRDHDVPVLGHVPATPLDLRGLAPLLAAPAVGGAGSPPVLRRCVLLIRHGAEVIGELGRFLEHAARAKAPLTVIVEERKNQWAYAAAATRASMTPAEYELGPLSAAEIERTLDALERHRALGRLAGVPRAQQVVHFQSLAGHELLVALRELTTATRFDDLIRDEYERVPVAVARRAYLHVAALGQFDLPLRYPVLLRLLGLRADQLRRDVFTPTDSVLLSGEAVGASRHTAGYTLRTRHPRIASVIFDYAAPDDPAKLAIIEGLLTHLDPGHREDARVLDQIARGRELVATLVEPANQRAVYDRLALVLPGNPYVLQHRSILERELGDGAAAVRFARQAVALDETNAALQNTLGVALERLARGTDDPDLRRGYLAEAESLFRKGIRRDRTNPFGYVGLAGVLRQRSDVDASTKPQAELETEIIELLENAYDATGESPVVASALAAALQALGEGDEAVAILERAVAQRPADTRSRELLVRLRAKRGDTAAALALATEGLQFAPSAWRLSRHAARLIAARGGDVDAVREHYSAAIRHRQDDIGLRVELGAFLFTRRRYREANDLFKETRAVRASASAKGRIRERWHDTDGRPVRFTGRVHVLRPPSATITAVPDGFRVYARLTSAGLVDLREGDRLTFHVGFNAFGPIAENIRRL